MRSLELENVMLKKLLAEAGFTRAACKSMRLFVSGSAPLLLDTFNEFRTRTGHTILERYGMSEAGMICSNPYEGERRGVAAAIEALRRQQ